MNGVRRHNKHWICPVRSKEEDQNNIMRYQAIKIWRGQILDKRFMNINAQIGIRRTAGFKNKEQSQNTGIHRLNMKINGG
jgi:hypothetical protein